MIEAFGFMDPDFILPVLFNLTFKPSNRSYLFWLNTSIAAVFSALGLLQQFQQTDISLDAKTYQLFANV